MLSVTEIASGTQTDNLWSELTREIRSNRTKTCPRDTLSTIDPTRNGVESNPCLRSDRSKISRISYGTVILRHYYNDDK